MRAERRRRELGRRSGTHGTRQNCNGFFFQAEDGIRDGRVTGVQTCARPIYVSPWVPRVVVEPGVSQSTRPSSRGDEYQFANLALAVPPWPVLLVQSYEDPRGFERLRAEALGSQPTSRSKGIAWLTSPRPSGRRAGSPRSPAPGALR